MKQCWRSCLLVIVCLVSCLGVNVRSVAGATKRDKLIVLIAGPKSHGPGEHEYLKSIKLLKVLLDRAPNLKGVRTEIYFNGWPDDPRVFDRADTVAFLSDGEIGDTHAPFMTDERMGILEKEMKRGCGFVTFHFSTFSPEKYAPQILEWTGGYFDWQSGHGEGGFTYFGPNNEGRVPKWHSSIRVAEADVQIATPRHPIVKGVSAFHLKDEFYYQLAFRKNDPRLRPILRVPSLSSVPTDQIVAWAVRRRDGGRGFGAANGHYYDNWQNDDYRKLILNALVWTAGAKVPKGGVKSSYINEDEVERAFRHE